MSGFQVISLQSSEELSSSKCKKKFLPQSMSTLQRLMEESNCCYLQIVRVVSTVASGTREVMPSRMRLIINMSSSRSY